ncbi:MAG: segregation/condensation protein A [Deltaproteobacteria bacterium]|nr:segregation/condensation protein A [Deltaproteobacteria bacterium]
MEQKEDQTPYQVSLGELFDGPMDLLVHLVKKNELDIYDIPIALITQQYMEYLEWLKSVNIDVAGEFLVMAATLTHIKSRMLDRLDWDVFLRADLDDAEAWSEGDPAGLVQVGLFELIDAFQEIVKRASPKYFFDITPDAISVKSRISQIADILEERGSATFPELFDAEATRGDIIVTFLAILEMTKLQLIRIMQHIESGIIRIFDG